jgi:hypothetical protein
LERKYGAGRRTVIKAVASAWPEPRKSRRGRPPAGHLPATFPLAARHPARRRGGHLGLDPAVYERDEIEASLNTAGFEVDEVLDAPDRPGLERVFVARRP